MTHIIWLLCPAILWITAVDTQVETVYPLVMAIYSKEYRGPITLTDSKEANDSNLKLPIDNKEPTFIALLCEDIKTHYFIVKQVIDKIGSIDKNLTCEHHSQANVRVEIGSNNEFIYRIGFHFKVTEEILFKLLSDVPKKEAAATESFKLLGEFAKIFQMFSSDKSFPATSLRIRYDFERGVPLSITHTVKAHMHSNTYEEECKEIDVRKYLYQEKRSYEDLVAKFASKEAPSHHQWRQLVPMQDFKGIYTTQATCIYLNYLILHENTINTLRNIEFYIRRIADVINEVDVITGTYTKEDNNSDLNTVQNENTIPTIVWKKISYTSNCGNYAILAIIHNKETKRICSEKDALGWPDDNKNEQETGIGVMYYCLMDDNVSEILDLKKGDKYSPFNLREVQYENKKIDLLERIINSFPSPKTEN